jgi:hypothetical protein
MSEDTTAFGHPLASSSSKPMTLTHFFRPANTAFGDTTSGAQCSGRTAHPSTKVTDPDNMKSQAFFSPSGIKCKAGTQAAGGMQQPYRL